MLKQLLTGFVVFYLPFLTLSQPTEWEFDILPLPKGKSGNATEVFIQDATGYMWIGTQNGLHRYDGKNFKTFQHNPADTNSLADNYIKTLYEDHEGYIWIGTSSQGLDRFDPVKESFRHFPYIALDTTTKENHLINDILEDSARNLWVGTLFGLYKLDRNRQLVKYYNHNPNDPNSLSYNRITDLLVDKQNTLWVATGFYWFDQENGGLNRYDEQKDHFIRYVNDPNDPQSLGKNSIWSLLEDSQGNFWIGTGGRDGLYSMDREKKIFHHYPFDPDSLEKLSVPATAENYLRESIGVWGLFEDQAGRLWILSFDRGLSIYDTKTQVLQHYPRDRTLIQEKKYLPGPSTNLVHINQFRDGSMWIGGGGNGLLFHTKPKNQFLTYIDFAEKGITPTGSRKIYEDQKGNIWLGLSRGELIQFNSTLTQYKQFTNLEPHEDAPGAGNIRSIVEDDLGNIWIGLNIGIDLFNASSKTFTLFPFPTPPNPLPPLEQVTMVLHKYGGRNIWAGSYSWGLFRYDIHENKFYHYPPVEQTPNSLKDRHVSNMFTDSKNRLWIMGGRMSAGSFTPTSDFGFIDQWNDENNTFVHHLPMNNHKIFGGSAISMVEDSIGNFWFVAWNGGLHKYNPENRKLEYFNPDNGKFPEWDTRWIVQDENQTLWIGTLHHLYEFNPENGKYESFTLSGEHKGENIRGQAIYSQNKEILFLWGNGIYRFDPEKYKGKKISEVPPQITFSDLFINEERLLPEPGGILSKPLRNTDKIILKHNQNIFSVGIHNFHFVNAELNYVEYKLEPYDSDWRTLGTDQLATYNQVLPGTYTLLAKGFSSEGLGSETKQLKIVVRPPWWQSDFAYAAYIILAILAVWAFIQWRTKTTLRQLAAQEKINQRLKQVDKLKDQFLANTSHELRTPLNGIIGLSEAIFDRSGSAEDKEDLSMVISSGKRLSSLVNDILDFSKLKDHQIELRLKPIDIRALVDIVLRINQPLVEGKNLILTNEVPDDLPLALADEDRIQQILFNLVGNAVKFTEEGEVKVQAQVSRSSANEEEVLKIVVQDTGIGIPKEKQDTIFQEFQQADGSISRDFSGTGLGLSISKKLVELHGGDMWVESEEGESSVFFFTLSMASSKAERVRNPISLPNSAMSSPRRIETLQSQPVTRNPQPKNSIHILVVDDEPINQQVIKNHLSKEHFQLTQAMNGEEALKLLNNGHKFDLVLLDVMMPRMSGYEVCEKIRDKYLPSELPVIMVTAKNQVADLVQGLNTGANDYVAKPFSKDEFLARVKTHLNLHQINRVTNRFVPTAFLKALGKSTLTEVQLGDQTEENVTVFFSDIRGYTTLAETMTPEENFRFVNAYAGRMGPIIQENKGFVNQYLGDGIMAIFQQNPTDGLKAAIEM